MTLISLLMLVSTGWQLYLEFDNLGQGSPIFFSKGSVKEIKKTMAPSTIEYIVQVSNYDLWPLNCSCFPKLLLWL